LYAFDKYYNLTGDVPAYGAALLLAPQRRCQYIERNWKKSWIPAVIDHARKLWQDEYKHLPGPAVVNPTSVIREPDEYDLWEREQTVMITHGDEFERFIHGDPIPLPSVTFRQKHTRLKDLKLRIPPLPVYRWSVPPSSQHPLLLSLA
jgi:hypothetical protein